LDLGGIFKYLIDAVRGWEAEHTRPPRIQAALAALRCRRPLRAGVLTNARLDALGCYLGLIYL